MQSIHPHGSFLKYDRKKLQNPYTAMSHQIFLNTKVFQKGNDIFYTIDNHIIIYV